MTDDVKLPPLPNLQVPIVEGDISLTDVRVLCKWAQRVATAYARLAIRQDRARRKEAILKAADRIVRETGWECGYDYPPRLAEARAALVKILEE